MTEISPRLDKRSAEDIIRWLKQRPEFEGFQNDPLSEALVRIFARYCEIIIERLNRAPEKNYRAFLNELGVYRCPPEPARVPLTFTPVKNPTDGSPIVVPQYTQVTAPPAPGESSLAVFETNLPLTLTQAELKRIVAVDYGNDRFADLSALSDPESKAAGAFPFKGSASVPHEFYIDAGELAAQSEGARLQLRLAIDRPLPSFLEPMVTWRIECGPEGSVGIPLHPVKDTSMGLSRSGEIEFSRLPKWEMSRRAGASGYWLSCRLSFPGCSKEERIRQRKTASLLTISRVELSVFDEPEDRRLERSFCNGSPVDLSKDFLPLGERPHFGDVWYLDCAVFSRQGADVKVGIVLTNPASGVTEPPVPRVNRSGQAAIQWEYWNGSRWGMLECFDGTQGLTENGFVSFRVPMIFLETRVNGFEGSWIRARLISGHYGTQESIEYNSQDPSVPGIRYRPSTLAPPLIASLSVSSTKIFGPLRPAGIMTHNGFVYSAVGQGGLSFRPFQFGAEANCALYLGLRAGNSETLSGRWLDLYFGIGQAGDKAACRSGGALPVLKWEYWDGRTWNACRTRDGTEAFQASGVVSVWAAEDIAVWKETSLAPQPQDASSESFSPLYWIRAVWTDGDCNPNLLVQRVLVNTTLATHTLTLENEILGSAIGVAGQVFYSARKPIVRPLILEVREPQAPSRAEWIRIAAEEGEESAEALKTADRGEVWVRWREVDDFLESGSADRHFTVERLSGQIRFGDGKHGMLPPAGANNVRLSRYKTGGGASGNRPVRSIATLRTGLPLVASVLNHEAATGGLDTESWDSVYGRGSRVLRHRGRAVTAADYEDLARLASPLVAKAKCFPLKDLDSGPDAGESAGVVSLAVVPRISEPAPRPSFEMLRRVWTFMDACRDRNAELIVLGPRYVRVCIRAAVAPAEDVMVANLAAECQTRLEAYLHPLTGGLEGNGWDFGARPHQSDIFALLESAPGLDHVQSLQMFFEEEQTGSVANGTFLICSGRHRITQI